jgi:hypothetical protein
VKVRYDEGIANRIVPEPCIVGREASGEARDQKRRRPSLTTAINQAVKAGASVDTLTEASIGPDGTVSLKFGKRNAGGNNENPWDEVLIDASDKKRSAYWHQ